MQYKNSSYMSAIIVTTNENYFSDSQLGGKAILIENRYLWFVPNTSEDIAPYTMKVW